MIWAILISLVLICVMVYRELSAINEKLGDISSACEGIQSSATEIEDRMERPYEPTPEPGTDEYDYELLERMGAGTGSEDERREVEKRIEERRKRREEEQERQRAWTKEQIEKAWGGWQKAAVVSRRHDAERLILEYGLLTPDRTYTVRAETLLAEWEGKPGTEAEYATHPNLRFFYIRKSDGGFVKLDIVEEKLTEPAPPVPRNLFD
jgi:hypothetical protein